MKMLTSIASACCALVAWGGGAAHAAPAKMAVSFTWCGTATPATKVTGIPAGTAVLRFRLRDHQAPSYPHGGGEYPAAGRSVSIPCGGLRASNFDGPHPPPPQVHDYEWTVSALNAKGSLIATGSAVRKFPQ